MIDLNGRAGEITALALRASLARRAPAGNASPQPDCWCHGAGGRDPRYLPDPLGVEQAAHGDPDLLRVFGTYCPCETGKRQNGLEDDLRAAVFAAQDELRAARLWGAAGVPPHYQDLTLETYPATPATAQAVALVREWLATDDRWLLLWGDYGTGKTGLAVAALRERVRAGCTAARFITVPDLLTRLRHSYDRPETARAASGRQTTERELLDDLLEASLLVLDDLGAERATDWAVERLFGVLNRRHDWHRQTVLTTNLSPRQLAEHAGQRIVWRIVEMCRRGDEERARYLVELRGPNLRDQSSGRERPKPDTRERVSSDAEPSPAHVARCGRTEMEGGASTGEASER